MADIPRGALSRTARLASLPISAAGRATLGLGQRLVGRDRDEISSELQRRTAEQVFEVLGTLKGGAMKFGQALSVYEAAIPDEYAAPIVATFRNPDHAAFSFQALFEGMKARGFIIFPGRLALADTFRIGCMGDVTEQDMAEAMNAVAETIQEMGITGLGRAKRIVTA